MTTIRTNNHVRESKYYPNMTPSECKQVESAYGGLIPLEDSEFVFYKGNPYFMGDCMRLENNTEFKDWDGYFSETFFSCVLVKYARDEYGNLQDGYIFGIAYS